MKLVITNSIYESEFLPLSDVFTIAVIKAGARKSLLGLGTVISGSRKISGTVLKKLKLTSTGGAGRVLFLIQINKETAVLLMLRHKNDTDIGENMAITNPRFKKKLDKNLDRVAQDLQHGNFQEFKLD